MKKKKDKKVRENRGKREKEERRKRKKERKRGEEEAQSTIPNRGGNDRGKEQEGDGHY